MADETKGTAAARELKAALALARAGQHLAEEPGAVPQVSVGGAVFEPSDTAVVLVRASVACAAELLGRGSPATPRATFQQAMEAMVQALAQGRALESADDDAEAADALDVLELIFFPEDGAPAPEPTVQACTLFPEALESPLMDEEGLPAPARLRAAALALKSLGRLSWEMGPWQGACTGPEPRVVACALELAADLADGTADCAALGGAGVSEVLWRRVFAPGPEGWGPLLRPAGEAA